ncbi:MAG: ribonuclease H-like YkuK family protein [bacterium]
MKEFKKPEWDPFVKWKWRSYDGKKNIDVCDFIENRKQDLFFIGTDSQNYSKNNICQFTTVLIAYRMKKGGAVITHKIKVPYMDSLRQRLVMEAMLSLEVAWYLDQKIPKESIVGIHLDVNRNLKYKSGQYKDELVGMIIGQGFNALTKPDAWAASSVADAKC